jgi:hypothetical protein
MKSDYINGVFEGGGAMLQVLNIRQILKDKIVRGVHWGPLTFWTAWGYWNIFYYPSLDQWCSFVGGLGVVLCNTINLYLMWKYWPRKPALAPLEMP